MIIVDVDSISEKVVNRLKNDTWFHATTLEHYQNIHKNGVCASYNKGGQLDFGYGFYLSPKLKDAEQYIQRLYKDTPRADIVIIEFNICPYNIFVSNQYRCTIFQEYDMRFANFVFENRTRVNDHVHDYDMIYGVMSDSVPTSLILQYQAGDIEKGIVLDGLMKSTSAKQLFIRNQEICNTLTNIHTYTYDMIKQEVKEMGTQ